MLKVQNVSFNYTELPVLHNISFTADKGEYVAVIGSSGCGKSTLLEIIYGLLHIDQGTVYYKNEKLLGPNFYLVPGESFMKYLPQDFDLMPYITVAENVGKFLSNMYPEKKTKRIMELLGVVEMTEFANTKVKYLSGGQKQRVALARVLAKEPEVMLLDEPFSHIDNFRKNSLRRSLFSYLKKKQITCLVATHDTTDALSFADKTIVIKDGAIIANDHPVQLYNQPKSKYIASFFGDVNELPAAYFLSDKDLKKTVLIYPSEFNIVEHSNLKVTVKASYFKGNHFLIESTINKQSLFFEHTSALLNNQKVYLKVSEELVKLRLT